MKRVLFSLCVLACLAAMGCGPKLTKEEETAPPPRGPNGGYQPPPPGANPQPARGARGSHPGMGGGGAPPGANPGMGR
ncbi:MAG: hypothetical protein QM758_26695 [Armatimonas sp.]